MNGRKLQANIITILCAAVLCSCSDGNRLEGFDTYAYFDTRIRWVYTSQSDDERIWNSLKDCAASMEASLSVSDTNSSVSRFNAAKAGEKVQIDQNVYTVLQTAQEIYNRTNGAYNPALGGLIDLWGFSPRHNASDYAPSMAYDRVDFTTELPEQKYIDAFLTLTDFSEVELVKENDRYFAYKPDVTAEVDGVGYTMQLNLGGIGKGACIDEMADIVGNSGYVNGYINLGISSMVVFENPKIKSGLWEIEVNSPREEFSDGFLTLKEKNTALSSSGDSERYYVIDGTRYSHIINPTTGYPASVVSKDGNIAYAAIAGLSAAEGDATSTALIAMGLPHALSYIRTYLTEQRVYLVCHNGTEYCLYTNADSERYTLYADLRVNRI